MCSFAAVRFHQRVLNATYLLDPALSVGVIEFASKGNALWVNEVELVHYFKATRL